MKHEIQPIYVDGSGKGVGLHCKEGNYHFPIENTVSTNDNEMLALILGLKYAIFNNYKIINLYSDSMISVNIVAKGYSLASHLNRKAKIFNKLKKYIERRGGIVTIVWIEGKTNLADSPSRGKGEYKDGWSEQFACLSTVELK